MVKKIGHETREESVAVAINNDKGSQEAVKWAVANLLNPGETLTLVHVRIKHSNGSHTSKSEEDVATELFLPFHCFCTRKDINCEDVIVDEVDAARGIINYTQENAIEILVLGASKKTLLKRFKAADVSRTIMKGAPSFCTVYAISRGKISSIRSATCSPPPLCTIRQKLQVQSSNKSNSSPRETRLQRTQDEVKDEVKVEIKSPFMRREYEDTYQSSMADSDISFVSSERPSMDWKFPTPCRSVSSESEKNRSSFATLSHSSGNQSIDLGSSYSAFSSTTVESGRPSCSMHSQEDLEAEMRKLKIELKHTMGMYSSACKEAIAAKKMTMELHKYKAESEHKLEEVRHSKEVAMAMAESEKGKREIALEALMVAHRKTEFEFQKRKQLENNLYSLAQSDRRCRKYTIEEIEIATNYFSVTRKIGEGGYGPVFKGTLNYTPVAIKVLRPDAKQGRSQFQQEVEVLTCIRHPNMVLLLGACTEYGCLVYEYMANGSLEDCLFRRGNSPMLPWQIRFRITAEIAIGLNFLHQMKPEPFVHRDLKPANILLDQNFVSKISDVGLARLVPPSVVDTITQYRMTTAAGTWCYIDPEYQQTGMLGTKSDTYSFGIMLLQILTAKPPMSLTHRVKKAIEEGTFTEILDPAVPDWPVEEALVIAKLGLHCSELRRKDRPNLGNEVLPVLKRLMVLADKSMLLKT